MKTNRILTLALAGLLCITGATASAAEQKKAAKKPAAKAETKAAKPAAKEASQEPDKKKLLDPASLTEKAPDVYRVRFDTSKGAFVVEVTRAWAPNGADRFYNLVKNGFYDDVRFFRVISGFMAQFGINGDPAVNEAWKEARIDDDPVTQTNARGMISFATRGPNTRTTQLFINYVDNFRLDGMGFAPFAKVVEGMDVVDALNAEYGEGAPRGWGPDQGRMQSEGNAYLAEGFARLDYVKTARIVK